MLEDNSGTLKFRNYPIVNCEKEKGEKSMNKTKMSVIILLAMMSLSFAAVLPVHAPAGGVLYIDPDPKILSGAGPGVTFYIDVCIKDVPVDPGIGGVQVKITWDSAVLHGLSASLPAGHFMEATGDPANQWVVSPPTATDNEAWCGVTFYNMTRAIEKGYAPKSGAGVIMRVQLENQQSPPWKGFVDTDITFVSGECVIGDKDGNALARDLDDGYYKNEWAAPSPVHFKVDTRQIDPTKYVAKNLNEEFEIDIKLQDVSADWHLVGFQFMLHYNTTLLEVLDVMNGTFLEGYAGPPNGGMFYIKMVEDDYVIVAGMILPDSSVFPPVWHPPFPSGEGVIATIKFKAILQGMFPITYSCALDLDDDFNLCGDEAGESIPVSTPARDGTYEIKPKVLGRMIDVFIGSDGNPITGHELTPYPDPYGGQGRNMTADLIYPQKKIYIWAVVTYNEWPEQRKPVTFELIDPQGESVAIFGAVTNETGVAFADFRIPWPEYEWALCHVFTLVASVDIASTQVKDWLWFHYDYVVRIDSVLTDKTEYKHCEYMNVTVIIKSKAILYYPVVITITLKDELQYFYGFGMAYLEVGGTQWCTYKYYAVSFLIHVHKHVRAGVSTIHVNALDNLPSLCGSAWCPEYVDPLTGEPPTINILAEWA